MFPVDKKALAELLVLLGVDTAKDWDVQTMQDKVNTNGITYYLPQSGLPVLDADAKYLLGEIMERQSRGEKIEVVGDPFAYISQPNSSIPEPEKTAEVESTHEPLPLSGVETSDVEMAGTEIPEQVDILQCSEPSPDPKPKRRTSSRKSHSKTKPSKPAATKPHKTHKKSKTLVAVWDKQVKQWQRKPLFVTDRGAGVTRTIIQELEKAGREKKPITKSKLLKILVKAFPDRRDGAKKMRTTIDNLLGSKLRTQYGLKVGKTKELTKVKNRCPNCGCPVKAVRGERGYWLDGKSRQVG